MNNKEFEKLITLINKARGIKWYRDIIPYIKYRYRRIPFIMKRKKEEDNLFFEFLEKRDELIKSVGKKELYELIIKLERKLKDGMITRLEKRKDVPAYSNDWKEEDKEERDKLISKLRLVAGDKMTGLIMDMEKGLINKDGNVILDKEESLKMLGSKDVLLNTETIKEEEK